MKEYNHKSIESKWQKIWEKKKIFEAKDSQNADLRRLNADGRRQKSGKFYGLIEFPYPSGEGLHVGHVRSNTAMDVIARKRRMEGFNVLYPIGWDAFGLPTENYAIKTGIHPINVTKQNTDTFRRQLKALGFSFDWSREINTADPKYYKWTQWIFLQLYKHGLAYKKKMPINWCPSCKIGLANEEVADGKCERCGTPTEKKEKEQWMLAITKYADRLDKDLDSVDYLERIKIQQRNWIGKSEGALIKFEIRNSKSETNPKSKIQNSKLGLQATSYKLQASVEVFTTRPDTLFGATYLVLAPEHSAIKNLESRIVNREEVNKYVEWARKKTEMERTEEGKEKTGVELKGIKAINPANGEEIPVWIADYVLAEYGTGAIMAVPAHDERDFEFAKKYNLPIRYVVAKECKATTTNIAFRNNEPVIRRNVIRAVVQHWSEDKYLVLKWSNDNWKTFISGGIENGESPEDAARREILEETGYVNAEFVREIGGPVQALFYAPGKKQNRIDLQQGLLFKLKNGEKKDVAKNEQIIHTAEWIPFNESNSIFNATMADQVLLERIRNNKMGAYLDNGALINSGVLKANNEPCFEQTTEPGAIRKDLPFVEREAITAVVKHWSEDKYLTLKWKKVDWRTFITGGIEKGQTPEVAAIAEILEETGYKNPIFKKNLGRTHSKFFHVPKNENRFAHFHNLYFELKNGDKAEVTNDEKEKHEVVWLTKNEVAEFLTPEGHKYSWRELANDFNGMRSEEAKWAITKAVGGKKVTKFKLRDWVFSRQHYWGEPLPIIFCENCGQQVKSGKLKVESEGEKLNPGWFAVPEKDLPIELPKVEKYQPTDTGESPLASIKSFVDTRCPQCGGPAKRETDTMPNWAGSSWYYLRYIDPKNNKEFVGRKKLDYWSGISSSKRSTFYASRSTIVDWYNGGMEHTTLHLLYSRFWHKFLFDIGVVPTSEPYKKRTSHGIILAEGGLKMSKSRPETIVNPDQLVERFGADAFRVYEMFMGPFDQSVAWNTDGLVGTRRFLEKVWRIGEKVKSAKSQVQSENKNTSLTANSSKLEATLHRTVKKADEDIEEMRFNTAISALMICANEMDNAENVPKELFEMFLKILSPFAPHIAEELWQGLGHKDLIAVRSWPSYEPAKIVDETVTIVVQVNGKVRGQFSALPDISESSAIEKAKSLPEIQKWLADKLLKKVIFVKGKLVNLVV